VKFDLDKEGLETVLLPWQLEVIRFVWSTGEVNSRSAWSHLEGTEYAMSRASVINFLNEMVDEGFIVYEEATGKGGYHRIYSPAPGVNGEEVFKEKVIEKILVKIKSEFSNERDLFDNENV